MADGEVKVTITEDIKYKGVFRKSTEYITEVKIEGEGDLGKLANNFGTYIDSRSMNSYEE
ncbi:MAG: hypothetical protein JW789_04570 [Candidatus Aenigmarchaeota archaeon]|nr:hypothetical protein [Candidatus Aenigmarchaeota archaeon]